MMRNLLPHITRNPKKLQEWSIQWFNTTFKALGALLAFYSAIFSMPYRPKKASALPGITQHIQRKRSFLPFFFLFKISRKTNNQLALSPLGQDWTIHPWLNCSLVRPIIISSLGLRKGPGFNEAHSFSEQGNKVGEAFGRSINSVRHTSASQGGPSHHSLTKASPKPMATFSISICNTGSQIHVHLGIAWCIYFEILMPVLHPRDLNLRII